MTENLLTALKNLKKNKSLARKLIETHPEMACTLLQALNPSGDKLFTPQDVIEVFIVCRETIEKQPQNMLAVLNNPRETAAISRQANKAAALSLALKDPFNSTRVKNPHLFPRLIQRRYVFKKAEPVPVLGLKRHKYR